MGPWTSQDAESLYNVPNWGGGYFGINAAGHVVVHPEGPAAEGGKGSLPPIDVFELIRQIRRRGIDAPVLLRFNDILRGRVREIHRAFDRAREEHGYEAPYHCVFPIKVNQQRQLVDVLMEEGRSHGMGIEVGSKPELLAVMGLYAEGERLIVCNGYKDSEYVETALLISRLGPRTILVVEKYTELEQILQVSESLGIRPRIGVRSKLGGRGAGRWMESGGDRSKFGLTIRQIVDLVDTLRDRDMLDCLELLHFHIGSQVTRIRSIKGALQEAGRTLSGLSEMGAHIRYMDVGGGLGIDYDGSRTDFESSMNYSIDEYAADVVHHIKQACDEADIPEPILLSESGRALTAHHAILVTEVIGVSEYSHVENSAPISGDEHDLIQRFRHALSNIDEKGYQEAYHDAIELREEAMMLFNVGQLTLPERARVDELFWRACNEILAITRTLSYVPDDLERLERDMADTYFLNFSVFQSMPDAWAIQQLFPVLPLHRNDEKPERRGVLADITCDSDGKIDRFIDLRDVKPTLELHSPGDDERYYLGFFLVGAYQEILGDMHNLFGDTHVVHVDASEAGRPQLSNFVPGDKVEEVLSYVEYFRTDLLSALRKNIERAIDEDRLGLEESAAILRRFEAGLASYTYLITPDRLEEN